MQKKLSKRIAAWILAFVSIVSICGPLSMTAEAVTPSKQAYHVFLSGGEMFFGSKKSVSAKEGTECFLTYTVAAVEKSPKLQGLCGTSDPKASYPYTGDGFMRYCLDTTTNPTENLMVEGATYYIRYKVSKGCFEYDVTRQLNGKLENICFQSYEGKGNKLNYFGLWFALSAVKVELKNVRCYDAEGNDLGLQVRDCAGVIFEEGKVLKKDTEIDHSYEVIVNNKANVAISHIKEPTTDKVFLEYKVKSMDAKFTQEGIGLSNKPLAGYPHSQGTICFSFCEDGKMQMLDVGAEYIVSMERQKGGFVTYVQKTKDGKVSTFCFNITDATKWDDAASIFYLWFGESKIGSFHLTDFKFYDANKNHLGIQSNQEVTFIHHGALEDYAGCEATYYCSETRNSFALYKDQKLKFTDSESTLDGTYSISENVMNVKLNNKSKVYDYLYARITDDEKNMYDRLYNYRITFVTGTDDVIEPQEFSNEKGYIAMKPSNPNKEGYEFVEWCLKDGTPYQFEQLVTDSITLYAKYSGDGRTFLASQDDSFPMGLNLWWIGGGMLLFLGVAVACVFFIRKERNHGRKKETN